MIEATERKLREAQFFYQHLRKSELDTFRFYFSAFLSAAISVPEALSFEGKKKYRAWKPKWETQLTDKERDLEELVYQLRVEEVHLSGAHLTVEMDEVTFNEMIGLHSREHPAHMPEAQTGPPAQPETPIATPVKFGRLVFYLESKPGRAKAIAVCKQYLEYLEKLVRAFRKEHP